MSDLGEILAELDGQDTARVASALNKARVLLVGAQSESTESARLLTAGFEAMERLSARYPVAESLARFGQLAVSPARAFLQRTTDREMKVLCALILLTTGGADGVPVLLDELRTHGEYHALAASLLSEKAIHDALPLMQQWLLTCPLGPPANFPTPQQDEVLAYLRWIKRFGEPLPTELRQRLTAPGVSEHIRAQAAAS